MNVKSKELYIIKYGSNTLVQENAKWEIEIDTSVLHQHWEIINTIDSPIILVSSWAVAFWKTLPWDYSYIQDEIIRKRVYAALWNPHLSIHWDSVIHWKNVLQGLLTHRDLSFPDSQEKILEIMQGLFQKNNTIIQVNDNDVVTDEELQYIRWWDFGDNDETTYLIAKLCSDLFQKITVIINTSSNGVYNEDWETLRYLNPKDMDDTYIESICSGKSKLWTGGMVNKLKIVKKIAEIKNSTVFIVNGKNANSLKDITTGRHSGTKVSSKA